MKVQNLFDRYLAATCARRRPVSEVSIRQRLRRLTVTCKAIGLSNLGQVGPDTFGALTKALQADGLSGCSVSQYLTAYRSVMHWAARCGLIASGKLGDMSPPRFTRPPIRSLNKEEIDRLVASLDGQGIGLCVHLAVYQGLRRREIADLTPEDVNLETNEIVVRRGKNNKPRTLQLHALTKDALQRWPLPVPLSVHEITRLARRLFDKLGWCDVHFHCLRHTCCTQMLLAGYDFHRVARFMGHSTPFLTDHYSHVLPGQLKPDW